MIYLIKLSSFSSCWNLAQCRQLFFLILFIAAFQHCEQGLTKKVGFGPGVVAYIFNPALRKRRLANLYGSEVNLVCIWVPGQTEGPWSQSGARYLQIEWLSEFFSPPLFFSSQEILDFKVLSIKQTQESTQRRREPPEEIQGWKDPEKEQQSNGAMFPPASQG